MSYGVSDSAALDVLLRLGVPVVRCDDPPSDAFFTERDGVATVRACVRESHGCVSLSALSRVLRVANVTDAFLRKHALVSASSLVLVQLASAADDDALGVCGNCVCTASFVRSLVAACRRDVSQSATAMLSLDDLVRRVALPAADLAALLRQCCCDDGATFDADARALLAPGFAKRSDAAVRSALLSFDEPVAIDAVVDAARLPRDLSFERPSASCATALCLACLRMACSRQTRSCGNASSFWPRTGLSSAPRAAAARLSALAATAFCSTRCL
jgi:hypothetical protein